MVKILMHGCNGRMGQVITGLVKEDENATITAGVDVYDGIKNDYPVFSKLQDVNVDFDVIIDFSTASVIDGLLDYCEAVKKPVVLCTTGLSEEQIKKAKKVSETVAVLRSANMSIGVNVIMKLLREAVAKLAPEGFDVEIVEKHHNQKLDAPSGTAIALADVMNDEMGGCYEYIYDRSQVRKKRDKKELGISAVRGGNIVGEHDVIFAGTDEVITISHSAHSKAIFAKGSIAAAKYIFDKKPGMYDMSDVMA
ncbi:MAG: 4-hydroxy-tetrahydrodipicolinate reductase [Lachnospiraceae bacterium]|jgi:dihydrodipicolinate reductase|nr:4-hydroxy-tetrahydrodipicolinate reductase [Lachnoclostridium sp.]MDD7521192.1 4-hydroxy-tetrahydrodipicolinate reductase [Lachnoclostridium sp.]MDY2599960.1 4-hydroxy-tetrahydrodipicolinate reductase [Lachnospiraceae bacterium]